MFAAIANQLSFIPHGVLVAHMTTLIPLLIRCLAVDQPDQLVLSTIRSLLALMADSTTAMLDYLDTLVSRLVLLARDAKSMVKTETEPNGRARPFFGVTRCPWASILFLFIQQHVRQLALKGLSEVRNAPQIVLLPLRSQVSQNAGPECDAEQCRLLFFIVPFYLFISGDWRPGPVPR